MTIRKIEDMKAKINFTWQNGKRWGFTLLPLLCVERYYFEYYVLFQWLMFQAYVILRFKRGGYK